MLPDLGPNFNPVLTIKPHHVLHDLVRNVLLRREEPTEVVEKHVNEWNLRRKYFCSTGYYEDVIGRSQEARKKVRERMTEFLTKVQELPDEAFVHLDIQPDGICKACIFGKHCTGIYYQSTYDPHSITGSEAQTVHRIKDELEQRGYKLGSDFVFQRTEHEVYNFQGSPIKDYQQAVPQSVGFNSLIVKVGPLKDVLQIPM